MNPLQRAGASSLRYQWMAALIPTVWSAARPMLMSVFSAGMVIRRKMAAATRRENCHNSVCKWKTDCVSNAKVFSMSTMGLPEGDSSLRTTSALSVARKAQSVPQRTPVLNVPWDLTWKVILARSVPKAVSHARVVQYVNYVILATT